MVFVALVLLAAIYLVVQAPPPLSSDETDPLQSVTVEEVLTLCATENAAVRALYTGEIVGPGLRSGLAFDEDWREPNVEAGPLPALFLRESARSLERSPIQLGLFLGSDFPIARANSFGGKQTEPFAKVRSERLPQFFFDDDTGRYTAMFPDLAVAPACVTCHNEHPESPKTDWALGDVMGATTWTYPDQSIPPAELANIVTALRQSFRDAYSAYLDEVATFSNPPEIGERWPAEGYFLPTLETFMAEVSRRTSPETLDVLLATLGQT
jgi:hypothetical protein